MSGTFSIDPDILWGQMAWTAPASVEMRLSRRVASGTDPDPGLATEGTWLGKLRSAFGTLRVLPNGWNGYGSKAIDPNLIYRVERVLRDALAEAQSPILPFVVPAPDGGIQVEWHRDSREQEVFFSPRGDVSALFEDHQSGVELEREGAEALALLFGWAPRLSAQSDDAVHVRDADAASLIQLAA